MKLEAMHIDLRNIWFSLFLVLSVMGNQLLTTVSAQKTPNDFYLPGSYSSIQINEIMPSNVSTLRDEDGDYEDWIELYNNSSISINLLNFKITDDPNNPNKWIFPSVTLGAHDFLLVFASGKDRVGGFNLHTNFNINASGELIVLLDPNGLIVDQLDAGEIDPDISYGRKPDGSTQCNYFYNTSPKASNNTNSNYCPIEISHEGGFYTSPFPMEMSSDTAADIYYTWDGSVPHPDSAGTIKYTEMLWMFDISILPNNISMIPTTPNPNGNFPSWSPPSDNLFKSLAIRSRTFIEGVPTCKTYTNTYMVNPYIMEKFTTPVFSIVTDSLNLFAYDSGIYVPGQYYDSTIIKSGNYYQTGIDWEKNIHLEYFSPDGQTLLDQDAGMRMHGNLTLTAPQKSLKFYARRKYGDREFKHELFPDLPFEEYKRFILRTSFASHLFTIIKDALIQDLVKDIDVDRMAVKPVIVLLNGEYWGIHNMRERQDKYYLEQHHDADPDSVDILAGWGEVLEGNATAYNEMYDFVYNNDLSIPENYAFVTSKIDVESYIDYYITETYFGNHDWPGNNLKFWRPQTEDGKWRYLLYDLDAAFKTVEFNALLQASSDTNITGYSPHWATLIFRKMLQNESFQQQFIGRYEELVNTLFSTESVINRIDEFEELYIQELGQHIGRWNWPSSVNNWQQSLEEMRNFASDRPCIVKEQLEEFFEIDSVNIICVTGFGVDGPADAEQLIVYPNPVKSNRVWLKTVLESPIYEFSIFDILGREILRQRTDRQSINVTVEIDISGLKPGIYVVGAMDFKNTFFTKLIVE